MSLHNILFGMNLQFDLLLAVGSRGGHCEL